MEDKFEFSNSNSTKIRNKGQMKNEKQKIVAKKQKEMTIISMAGKVWLRMNRERDEVKVGRRSLTQLSQILW